MKSCPKNTASCSEFFACMLLLVRQLEDHKKNRNSLTFRLIDPSKSELGKVSKKQLQDINDALRAELGCNH